MTTPLPKLWYTAANGWTRLTHEDTIAIMLNTEKVKWGISAITGEYIVPQWVNEALKTYNDNGGFAGMSPAEYLDRVADEKTDEPQHTF